MYDAILQIIPVGVVLPTISPILFGGVATGSAVTAFSSTLASSANFVIGRELLTEQVRHDPKTKFCSALFI
jgi:uncharacterized membrane protein YdjX (TVP38/TMEM64 family)